MGATPPFYADVADAPAGAQMHWVRTSDDQRLRVAIWPGEGRGHVVIFPGRTEFVEKYGRVVGKLNARGLGAAVVDWRGQGLSDRSARHAGLGHVEDFRDYQRDVAAVLGCAAVAALPEPRYLLAHSMGGCIGLRTLVEGTDFRGAIFTAPMWTLQMRAATRELTSRMAQLARLLGLGNRRTPGTGSTPTVLGQTFDGNVLTSDPEHFAWCAAQLRTHPDLALGGPSLQWTRAAIEEMARLYVAPMPSLPALVFLGSVETVVSPRVIRTQTAKMPRGELVLCEGARHEILMERPEVQAQVWEWIDAFLEAAR